jgi:hypothetical protein
VQPVDDDDGKRAAGKNGEAGEDDDQAAHAGRLVEAG